MPGVSLAYRKWKLSLVWIIASCLPAGLATLAGNLRNGGSLTFPTVGFGPSISAPMVTALVRCTQPCKTRVEICASRCIARGKDIQCPALRIEVRGKGAPTTDMVSTLVAVLGLM